MFCKKSSKATWHGHKLGLPSDTERSGRVSNYEPLLVEKDETGGALILQYT